MQVGRYRQGMKLEFQDEIKLRAVRQPIVRY